MLTWIQSIMKSKNRVSNYDIICACFALYFSIVIVFSVSNTVKTLWAIPVIAVLVYAGCRELTKGIEGNEVFVENCSKNNKIVFVVTVFGICFLCQILFWMAYYPGGFNLDAYGQWDQVHGRIALNNWHPVFTTFLYWLITRVDDSLATCIFVQLLAFSISITILLYTLWINGIKTKWLIIADCCIAINPAIGMNNVCLYKDVPFTIVVILTSVALLKIYYSKGEWLKRLKSILGLTSLFIMVMLIRHNGLFYVFAASGLLFIAYHQYRKRIVVMFVCVLSCVVMIEGPVFRLLNIDQHSNIVGEAAGIPMEIMANSLVKDYENTPDEVKEFLLEIADYNEWVTHHIPGEWDSCKWEFGGISLLEDESLGHIINMAAKTGVSCPEASYEAVKESTRVVWQIVGHSDWNTWVYIEENDYGIKSSPVLFCSKAVNGILSVSNTIPGALLTWNIGTCIALYLLINMIAVKTKRGEILCLTGPILVYDFLTTCLLCGPSHRYFYINTVLLIPFILVCLQRNREVRGCEDGIRRN